MPVLLCTTKYDSCTTPCTTTYYKVLLQYYNVLLLYYKVRLQYYSVPQSTTPVLLCTTKYYFSTTVYCKVLLRTTKYYWSTTVYYKVLLQYYNVLLQYYKVLLQYYCVLQSTTPVLQSTTPVLLCTTKYYSSTTTYYSSTTPYYKVLLQYYCVLLCTTKCDSSTTKYYSSTTTYYSVLQSTTLYYFERSFPMRGATGISLQSHQTLRLPRKRNVMIDPSLVWNVIYNAQSNRHHHATSPNTAPATQKECHDWSASHMKRHLQCAERQASPCNLTKYCACHAKGMSWLIRITYETSFTMRGATGITLQPHQILRLPRKRNVMIDPHHIWNVIYNAQSDRHHLATSPNTAPATQNCTPKS